MSLLLLSHSHALQEHHGLIDKEDVESVQALPEAKTGKAANKLSTELSIYVTGYHFDGNTVFSNEELTELTIPYIHRKINIEELIELKDEITSHYVNNGFINSGALLPDQDIEDGIIVFRIQEGSLEETEILNIDRLSANYILSRVERGISEPLNVFKLQENLKILEQDPNIQSIQANLEPGSELGSGILSIEVQEADRWNGGFEINNHSVASVGLYAAEFYANASNLTGMGDSLAARVGWRFGDNVDVRADENIFYSLYSSIPVNRQDTTLSAGFSKNDSIIIDENLIGLDIRNETYNYSLEIRHPVFRKLNKEFGLAVKLAHTNNATTISGTSIPSGSGRPTDRVTTLSFVQDWVYRSRKEVFALYSSVDFGIDLLNATMDPIGDNPDASFVTWLFQGQYLRRLQTWDSQILLKGTVRLSDSELLPTENFIVGGFFSVRGYRENTFTRDYGAFANIEYSIPVFELKLPRLSNERGDGQVKLTVFYDYGWAEDHNDTNESDRINYIHSVGAGILWQINRNGFAELYWGHQLKPVDYNDEYDLQEAGIHFRINLGLF